VEHRCLTSQIELIPPADYLRMSYYENGSRGLWNSWSSMVSSRVQRSKAPSRCRLYQATPPLTAEMVHGPSAEAHPQAGTFRWLRASKWVSVCAPATSTRRVTRACRGTREASWAPIARDHGVFVFPDTNAHFLGEKPQHVYSVRFAARELWGENAGRRDAVYVDLWDDHLEQA